jgi:hypothetical protein
MPNMIKRSKKGQATIEYLVLLAVAIIVGLVVLGFMGWIPGVAGSMRERQSKIYWASASPLSIKDYKGAGAGVTLNLENNADVKIIVKSISLHGNQTNFSGYQHKPGQDYLYNATATNCSGVGTAYEFDNVTIVYDVVGGISGNVESGEQPLIGRCAG